MGSPARGRPRTLDRGAALDTVVRLFWQRGYEATTMRDVTDALGVGAPSVYRTFGDKAQLFAAALSAYDGSYGGFIEQALRDEPSARSAAERMLREGPANYTDPDRPSGCLIASTSTPDPDAAERLREVRARKVAALASRIRDDVRAGALPADTDAGALARYTMAALTGLAQAARDGVSRAQLNRMAGLALAAWELGEAQSG